VKLQTEPTIETEPGRAAQAAGSPASPPVKRQGPIRRFLSALGPGVITGAADDDPSGIATYSVAGAQMGLALLWTALLTWPLMASVQMMCARIGMVTGEGLAGALRKKFPQAVLIAVAVALFLANSFNIGADLVGMADAAHMLTGINSHVFVLVFGIGITWATIRLRYVQIAGILKWLALTLVAYVITAFSVGPNWGEVLRAALVPSLPHDHVGWQTLVAILGTTISPYLFFWQTAQEVEEEKALGRRMVVRRLGATRREILDRKLDVGFGTFFSNAAMFFIILTTSLTLHRHGVTRVETSSQVAAALAPLAGKFAGTLYTVGLVGVGLLAIPTLAGSAAYAFAEIFHWRQGLDQKLHRARSFYGMVVCAVAVGIAIDLARLNPVRVLVWSAVANGVLAPFLLVGILLVASDRRLMNNQPSSRLSRVVVGVTAVLMFAAAAAMFLL
jgi:NRAMP (natural resistance-associated macrophage protein)-like metal ion transporter